MVRGRGRCKKRAAPSKTIDGRRRGSDVGMALSARLTMRQGQSMVLTPQLLQAIKLLQMPNVELSAFIENELASNPMLERAEDRERANLDRLEGETPPPPPEAPLEPGASASDA